MKFKIHPLAVFIIAFFIWNKSFAKLLLSILIHELGHAAAAFLVGKRGLLLTLSPFGWSLYAGDISGRAAGAFIYSAGPAVSLALAPLLSPQTLWVLVFNLIPVLPLDGGRIISALISERAAIKIGGYALLFAVLLSGLNNLMPAGVCIILLLHSRYLASARYAKIKRAADFLQDLY